MTLLVIWVLGVLFLVIGGVVELFRMRREWGALRDWPAVFVAAFGVFCMLAAAAVYTFGMLFLISIPINVVIGLCWGVFYIFRATSWVLDEIFETATDEKNAPFTYAGALIGVLSVLVKLIFVVVTTIASAVR